MAFKVNDYERKRRRKPQNGQHAAYINDIGAQNAPSAYRRERKRETRTEKNEDESSIEDQNDGKKINFIVKLRKLLCIFGQSFRLSSINCRYYWAIVFIIFIESSFPFLFLCSFLSACFILSHYSYMLMFASLAIVSLFERRRFSLFHHSAHRLWKIINV